MSGGVGPTGDIKLPAEEPSQETKPLSSASSTHSTNSAHSTHTPHLLSFRQLNSLAAILVLAASGMVSIEDFSFVVFSFLYIFLLSKFAFPTLPSLSPTPIFPNTKILPIYVSFAALIGLLLPVLYIFHGIIEGDKQGIKAAAPHVFLLASQVFMEGVTASRAFSIPIRVFVPVFFNTKRIFTLVDWLREEIGKVDGVDGGSEMRLWVGRGLAVLNLAFWCFNLFGFLLPVYLPRAFKKYYGGEQKLKD